MFTPLYKLWCTSHDYVGAHRTIIKQAMVAGGWVRQTGSEHSDRFSFNLIGQQWAAKEANTDEEPKKTNYWRAESTDAGMFPMSAQYQAALPNARLTVPDVPGTRVFAW